MPGMPAELRRLFGESSRDLGDAGEACDQVH
jgi:hypothetical protein